ncbi:hypothetical protein KKF34_07690 [Myxococcota bacterium]|nr:hypothetical protein [Myxococcota bacterium]MBU1381170.1 hypothetical protein [Myxococcota bacterium]MBU1496742.1 hypothetical protein [Myxococcota bacterium]
MKKTAPAAQRPYFFCLKLKIDEKTVKPEKTALAASVSPADAPVESK